MSPRPLQRWVLAAVGAVAVPVVALWNRLLSWRDRPFPGAEGASPADPDIVEHVRGWRSYLRGFDAHFGPEGHPDRPPAAGALVDGLARWAASRFLRGYTLGDDVYVCPLTPLTVRVHQAGHTAAFGEVFEPLAGDYRADGGLPDEPLRTVDVMLPGAFPHTFLRLTDRRGLAETYRAWCRDGRIRRVRP
ncbi:MAG: hypothetical protein ABEJ92_09635 [Halobacteriales archaeon]